MGEDEVIVGSTRLRMVIAAGLLLFASSGCMYAAPSGETPRNGRLAGSIKSALDSMEGVSWPARVTVQDKHISLWYWSEPAFVEDVVAEVTSQVDEVDGTEGWRLNIRSALTGRLYDTYVLPAWVNDGEQFELMPEVSMTVPSGWSGRWTRSPSSETSPSASLLVTMEEGYEDDAPSRTSRVRVESYPGPSGATAASRELAGRLSASGWKTEPETRFLDDGLAVTARRFIKQGDSEVASSSITTELIITTNMGSTVRVVRFDRDQADAAYVAIPLRQLAREMIGVLGISAINQGAARGGSAETPHR